MPKRYDMWTELKTWLELREAYDVSASITLAKMEELESEHE